VQINLQISEIGFGSQLVVLPKTDLDVQPTSPPMIVMNLVTPKVRAKHELLFNKPASEAVLLNKRWLPDVFILT